jgi:hypothetical protein
MSVIRKKKKDPESGLFTSSNSFVLNQLAERVGFEPTLEFPLNTLSKRAPSATRPSLRLGLVEGTTLKKLLDEPQMLDALYSSAPILWGKRSNRN